MSKKITELPAASAANLTDLLEKVNDPSGSPVSQKVSLTQVRDLIVPYKVYIALLDGSNPVGITVIYNTLGAIVWSNPGGGQFQAHLVGAFPADKTALFITPNFNPGVGGGAIVRSSNDNILVTSFDDTGSPSDDILQSATVEIRVYS